MRKKRFDPLLILFLAVTFVIGFTMLYNFDRDKEIGKSSYSTYAEGMKGLYLVLEDLGKDVKRWKRPFPLLEKEETGTLIVASPLKPLSPREKKALDSWFARGGKMILFIDGDWDIKASGYDEHIYSFREFFGSQYRLSIIGDHMQLTNGRLKTRPGESVMLIQQILSNPGAVYFDEYHLFNDGKPSSMELIKKYCHHPVGWVTLHLIVLFFLYLFSRPALAASQKSEKEEQNLVQAKSSFLELSKAKAFANEVISKYRRKKYGRT